MIPLLAIPVLHSSGAWIASTAASGYLATTLSGTWIGAFVLGNAGILSSLGLVSAGGILTAAGGGVAAVFGAAGTLTGAALTTVGLGSLAQSIGLAPATLLGMGPIGWVISGTAFMGVATLGYFISRASIKKINEERVKGGLDEITIKELLKELVDYEVSSMMEILTKLSKERLDFKVRKSDNTLIIEGREYDIADLVYQIDEDGTEWIGLKRKFRKYVNIFTVRKPTPGTDFIMTPEPTK